MTQTGSSNAIVNAMLGWLKGLAGWVLRLFNLSAGFSPLKFLADNWLKLLVLLLIVGMAADLLIWLIRWRPHWVWFHKKRVIINDKNFFAGENDVDDEDDWAAPARTAHRTRAPRRDWQDDDYVVAGPVTRRREERRQMRRKEIEERAKAAEEAEQLADDVFTDGMFNVNAKQKFSDRYEDEVFSVCDLPQPEKLKDGAKARKRGAAKGHEAGARGSRTSASRSRQRAVREDGRKSAAPRKRARASVSGR